MSGFYSVVITSNYRLDFKRPIMPAPTICLWSLTFIYKFTLLVRIKYNKIICDFCTYTVCLATDMPYFPGRLNKQKIQYKMCLAFLQSLYFSCLSVRLCYLHYVSYSKNVLSYFLQVLLYFYIYPIHKSFYLLIFINGGKQFLK